jgi:hypothetical protein
MNWQLSVVHAYASTGIRFPAEAKHFSNSLCVQTSYEAHPASYPMCIGGPFPESKAHKANHSPPSSAKVKNE